MNGKQWANGALVFRLAVPSRVGLLLLRSDTVSVSTPGSQSAHTLGRGPTITSAPIAHREKLRLREEGNFSLD